MQLSGNQAIIKSNFQQTRNEHFEMKFSASNNNQLGVLSQRNFLQVFEMVSEPRSHLEQRDFIKEPDIRTFEWPPFSTARSSNGQQ